MNYYLAVLKKYAVFSGRAQRAEYWYFVLFNIIIIIALAVIEGVLGSKMALLATIYALVILVPSIAVTIRRLHDANHSGWWWFISLIPYIGAIILLIFTVQKSYPDQNQYGPKPEKIIANKTN